MPVTIKSEREIELMRKAGETLARTDEELAAAIRPGMTTMDIEGLGEKIINDEVVHGIPSKHRYLEEGDIVSLDAGVIYKGYHSDAARTVAVGKISPEAEKLIEVTRQCFLEGMKFAKAGNHLNDISAAIQAYAEKFGYGVVRDLVGHGIGTHLHEDPEVPNFAQKKKGIRLEPGMTLAVEPMINMGRPDVIWMDDDWTVKTEDGSLSAHYENTILITDGEPELLSLMH